MVQAGFNTIFWGMMLLLVNLRIQSIDLLPDFIGYLLIVSGLGKLGFLSKAFDVAKTLAFAMIFLSLADLVEWKSVRNEAETLTVTAQITPLLILQLTGGVVDVFLFWQICAGIMERATVLGNRVLYHVAEQRRVLYLAAISTTWVAGLILPPLIQENRAGVTVLAFILLIIFLVAIGLMMGLMRRAGHELQAVS